MHPTTPATSLEPSSWPSAHCPTLSPARPYPPQRGPLRMRCCRPAWRATASTWRRRASPKSSPRCLPRERRATQRVHRSRGCRLSAGRRHERARRVSWSCVARAALQNLWSASAEFPPFFKRGARRHAAANDAALSGASRAATAVVSPAARTFAACTSTGAVGRPGVVAGWPSAAPRRRQPRGPRSN